MASACSRMVSMILCLKLQAFLQRHRQRGQWYEEVKAFDLAG